MDDPDDEIRQRKAISKENAWTRRKHDTKTQNAYNERWRTIIGLCHVIHNEADIEYLLDDLLAAANLYKEGTDIMTFPTLYRVIPDNMKLAVQEAMLAYGYNSNFFYGLTGSFTAPPPVSQDSAFCVYENNPYIVSSSK